MFLRCVNLSLHIISSSFVISVKFVIQSKRTIKRINENNKYFLIVSAIEDKLSMKAITTFCSDKVCRKCTQRVNADDNYFVVCKGACAGLFHCSCVGLRGMYWKTINDLARNIVWMCNCCMDDFIRTRNDNSFVTTTTTKTIEDDVNELKTTVAGIMNTIAMITSTVSTAVNPPINDELKISRRLR